MDGSHAPNLPISLHHTLRYRSCDEMCFGQAFCRFRKAKNKPSMIRGRSGGRRAVVGDEEFNCSTLSVQSEPPIRRAGDLEDVRAGAGNDDLVLEDPRSVSRPLVERPRKQKRSNDYGDRATHPEAQGQVRGEPSRGRRGADGKRVNQVNPPRSDSGVKGKTPPTSSISRASKCT